MKINPQLMFTSVNLTYLKLEFTPLNLLVRCSRWAVDCGKLEFTLVNTLFIWAAGVFTPVKMDKAGVNIVYLGSWSLLRSKWTTLEFTPVNTLFIWGAGVTPVKCS